VTATPADAVVFVLVDALRHDYVSRTRFLRELADRSLVGQLEEPFGFCPRGAYFGGRSMAGQGFTHLFHFDPDRSVFGWTRHLAGTGHDVQVRDHLRDEIVSRARTALPPFGAAIVDPLDIPLAWLRYFQPSEVEPPWSAAVGYRSLFHLLDEAGRPWLECSWPWAGWRGPLTSARVAGHAMRAMSSHQAFAYVHLPDLDAIGHQYGPGSHELHEALLETDRLCELLCACAADRFRDPIVVFAGDHGMLPVTRTVDVAAAIERTGLRVGHDLVFFIDSTMVRAWCTTEGARRAAGAALEASGGGRLLSTEDRARWGLRGLDRRHDPDLLYLAHPGVAFSPSFFDWSGTRPPRGMHGYAPDVADNRAGLIVHRPRCPEPGSLDVVEARRLFPSFLQWLGWDAGTFTDARPIAATARQHRRSRWSLAAPAPVDAYIDGHLACLVEAITERAPETDAVVLTGGFGRGEGTITGLGDAARPANDYDLLVVGAPPSALDGLGTTLAHRLEVDFVDLAVVPRQGPPAQTTQFSYDLRYGSRVLYGDPLVIDRLPRPAPVDVGLDAGVLQIGNRSGGLLLALTGWTGAADGADRFLARQLAKFLMAVADAWIMALGDYHHSYATRRARFDDLSAGSGSWPVGIREAIDGAYRAKLGLGPDIATSPDEAARLACRALDTLEGIVDPGRHRYSLRRRLEAVVRRQVPARAAWLDEARQLGLHATPAGAADEQGCAAAVYDACVSGLRAGTSSVTRDAHITESLAPWFTVAPPSGCVARSAASAWLSLSH
jgi:hypothetical protein